MQDDRIFIILLNLESIMLKKQVIKAALIMLVSFSFSHAAFSADKAGSAQSYVYKAFSSVLSKLPSECKDCFF